MADENLLACRGCHEGGRGSLGPVTDGKLNSALIFRNSALISPALNQTRATSSTLIRNWPCTSDKEHNSRPTPVSPPVRRGSGAVHSPTPTLLSPLTRAYSI